MRHRGIYCKEAALRENLSEKSGCMFIRVSERKGSCYLEFAYCRTNRPASGGKIDLDIITHWNGDSLLIAHDDNFGVFYTLYGDIFSCALLPNGKTGFDCYCPNYYDREKTSCILGELRDRISEKYQPIIPWLERAEQEFNGFYILGV